jgi:phosphate/phosphite/phosphonate ABC transporter binding protein
MARFLSARLGIPVGGTTSATYDDLQRIVSDGSVHMGIFSPAAYVTAQKAGLEAVPIATVTRNSSPTYLGCFVARAELPAPPLESFRDTRVAWVNRQSTSGYLYPRELMVARGLEPNQFFASEVFAGDHKSAVSIVAEGGAAIAAVAAPFVDPDAGMRVQGADKLVVVAKTRRIPLDCVVVHHRIQRDFAETLQRALFALSSDREASLALSRSWGLGGFVRPMIERYAEVAASLAAAEGVSAPILDSQDR